MKALRIIAALLLLTCCAGLYGCGGGGAKVQTDSSSATLGQELMDLDQAYEKGLISEKEYKKARKELIKKKTK